MVGCEMYSITRGPSPYDIIIVEVHPPYFIITAQTSRPFCCPAVSCNVSQDSLKHLYYFCIGNAFRL